ncbi:MAG: pentapeptide repeat-containing protein [Cyanobacteria bacterium P01_F01_bin.86]
MRHCYFVALSLLSGLFLASSAGAESPLVDVHSFNVRRLLSTNMCAGCDLTGVDLSGAHLIGADLRKANLTGANLSWTNLEGADLTKANLEGANLTGAFLTNARLVNADLDNANLSEAQLYFVDVTDASIENLDLTGATIVGTPISVGSGMELNENSEPVLSPSEFWQLDPPSEL